MPNKRRPPLDCTRIELDGIRYVILRESAFEDLCKKAGRKDALITLGDRPPTPGLDLDRATLAEKIRRRRLAAGLTQADLARRAGVRPETLNRIERGHTTPDFATVRKLVMAINVAEGNTAEDDVSSTESTKSPNQKTNKKADKELNDVDRK